jgi:hypothetical protein
MSSTDSATKAVEIMVATNTPPSTPSPWFMMCPARNAMSAAEVGSPGVMSPTKSASICQSMSSACPLCR